MDLDKKISQYEVNQQGTVQNRIKRYENTFLNNPNLSIFCRLWNLKVCRICKILEEQAEL